MKPWNTFPPLPSFPAPPLIFLSFHFPEKHNTVPVTKLVVRVEEVVALVTGEAVLEHDLYRHVEVSLRPLFPPLSLLSPETRQSKNRSSSVKRFYQHFYLLRRLPFHKDSC